MKKFLHLIILALAANGLLAYTVVVDNNGRLKAPSPATFKLANDILSVGGFLVNIDTTPTINMEQPERSSTVARQNPFYYKEDGQLKRTLSSSGATLSMYNYTVYYANFIYWTDAEFKVLDPEGNLIYWVSTQWGAQMGADYATHPAADLNAKIYYTSPDNEANGAGKGREWIEYVHNDTNARTIFEHAHTITGVANPTIGGIIIKPNFDGTTVGGTVIKEIFGKDNGNQYIFLKCSPITIEKSASGYAIWRTIVPVAIQGDD